MFFAIADPLTAFVAAKGNGVCRLLDDRLRGKGGLCGLRAKGWG